MENAWILEKLIFGIRHARTFIAADRFGDIVDKVIPLQGTGPFPVDCFQKVGRGKDGLSISLNDEEATLSVNFDVDGIVVESLMLTEPEIPVKTVVEMIDKIASTVMPLYGGNQKINRLGVVHKYKFTSFENSAKEIFSNIFNLDLSGTPDNINVRFSLKNPAEASIYKPGKKQDFKNMIVEISSERDDEMKPSFPTIIRLSLDYQRYYSPEQSLGKLSLTNHLTEAERYIEEHIKRSSLNFQSFVITHG